MEDVNMVRLSPLRPGGGGLKSPSSGKSVSPSFRRLNSSRTPRRESRSGGYTFSNCFKSNRILLWLLLITLWAYATFYFQSRWAHGDNKEDLFSGGYGGESDSGKIAAERINRRELVTAVDSVSLTSKNETSNSNLENVDVVLEKSSSLNKSKVSKKRSKKSGRNSRRKSSGKLKVVTHGVENEEDVQTEEIPKTNTTYGFLVGPFGSVEDSILEWSPEKRSGTCDRKGAFARLVWSRKFVLIFHELTMTGAPLAMLELATEFLSCGATISVIVLNKKGGLMPELTRRRIKVLEDKTDLSFKTAMKANLIIAGSAVCSSWIEQYLSRTVLGSSQIMWWIMENRREYFDRSKHVLNRVKKLIFLSELQSKQWLAWSEEENIRLKDKPALVPLSVNDELAFAAGISCSLNTPSFTTEKILEKRQSLRSAVREEMGLTNDDMLAVSLSSINPGKGQLLLVESARLVIEQGRQFSDSRSNSILRDHDYYSRSLFQTWKRESRMLSQRDEKKEQNLKVLIGSVGSRTADVYVRNSHGLGETFGRVTIEAMAFGLPVLGTDSGGFGELNVYERSVIPVPYAKPAGDFTLLVGDWYKTSHRALQEILDSGRPLPFPDAVPINGRGKSSFSGDQGKTDMFRDMPSMRFRDCSLEDKTVLKEEGVVTDVFNELVIIS